VVGYFFSDENTRSISRKRKKTQAAEAERIAVESVPPKAKRSKAAVQQRQVKPLQQLDDTTDEDEGGKQGAPESMGYQQISAPNKTEGQRDGQAVKKYVKVPQPANPFMGSTPSPGKPHSERKVRCAGKWDAINSVSHCHFCYFPPCNRPQVTLKVS